MKQSKSVPMAAAPANLPDPRYALYAQAGERVYMIEKLQAELNAIREQLDKLNQAAAQQAQKKAG